MKRILLGALMIAAVSVNAQDTKKVSSAYLLKRYAEAKTEVDRLMADPKFQSKPEVVYWHSTVYGALYDEETLRPQYPNALEVAYQSFNKYVQIEPSFKTMNESSIPGKAIIDFLYRNNLKHGIASFDTKSWDSAYKYFSRASEIGDLISKFDWRGNKQPIDTTTVLFSGFAAQNAKKNDDAAKFYTRLADFKITNAAGAGDLKDIYEFLVYYYMNKKDQANFDKYIGVANDLYPGDRDKWADYESEYTEKYMSLAEKAAAYDKADAAGTLTVSQYMAYGAMFYNIKEEEREKLDSAQLDMYRKKAEEAFVKAYGKDNNNGLAAYNVGLLNYNDWVALDEEYEGNIRKIGEINKNKPVEKDPKKKAAADAKAKKDIDAVKAANVAVEKKQHGYAEKGIQWLEITYKVLSAKSNLERMEKQVAGKTVDYLANFYGWKRDKSKGNAAEYDKYDALYKKYDALHGKFN